MTFYIRTLSADNAEVEVVASRAKSQEAAHRAVREMVRKYDMGDVVTVEVYAGDADEAVLVETFDISDGSGWTYVVHNAEEAWAGCTGANSWRTNVIAFSPYANAS
jgi:hypothetical protein